MKFCVLIFGLDSFCFCFLREVKDKTLHGIYSKRDQLLFSSLELKTYIVERTGKIENRKFRPCSCLAVV